jgi:hypothetical protein
MTADLVGDRRINRNQPSALAEFKRNENRGSLIFGGGRSGHTRDLHEAVSKE